MDVQHEERLLPGDEAVGGAGRQSEEITHLQRIRGPIEDGGAATRQDVVVLFRDLVITHAGGLMGLNTDAVGGAGSFVSQGDEDSIS